MLTLWILLVFLVATLVALVFSVNAMIHTLRTGLPYVTTPKWAIDWLANNLRIQERDVVMELGCGDARVLATLAKRFPHAKFLGIEIQWWPWLLAKWRTRSLPNIKIARGDLFHFDLSPAHFIYGFYITNFMDRLQSKLQRDLLPGTKVISYGFKFQNWKPVQEIPNPGPSATSLVIYER